MRRVALACTVVGLGVLAAAAVLAAALSDPPIVDDGRAAPVGVQLDPEQIYPSLAQPVIEPGTSYRRLFKSGHTLATAAMPACHRYRSVRGTWAERAIVLDESSLGAGGSKRAAVAYYAGVTWVSQNEATDFEEALSRISKSRLSVATGHRLERRSLVGAFTRDALDLCELGAAHARTREKLARLDRRIARILELARFDSSGLAEGAAQ
jgi:hypothetical protein